MSERLRDILTVVAIVAVLLLALWGVLALRRGRAAGPTPSASGGGSVEAPRRASPSPAAKALPPKATTPAGAATASRPSPSPVAATESTTKGALPDVGQTTWTKRQPSDFTPDDLAQCGRGVRVDLGKYEAPVGSEFDVEIRIAAPALESCTLVVQYDKGALAVAPGGAVPAGPQFRGGVESYAVEASGKLVVIQAGTPGRKNLDASTGSTAAVVCRMRALRPGVTHLKVLAESSFSNGRGEDEIYEVSGGEVSVH